MAEILEQTAEVLTSSWVREQVISLLSNVPGAPPVIQTLHLVCMALVMGSAGLIGMRMLGIAVPGQAVGEMIARLSPWTAKAVVIAFLSGLVFILARPNRYLFNPVAGIKYGLLLPALLLSYAVFRLNHADPAFFSDHGWLSKLLGGTSILLWTGVVFAGRWIAYVDYLFWDEA